MIGLVWSISPRWPSWKIHTVAPNVAHTENKKPMVAVSGTSNDRNTMVKMMKASPTTTMRNGSNALLSLLEISDMIAVWPPTLTVAPPGFDDP